MSIIRLKNRLVADFFWEIKFETIKAHRMLLEFKLDDKRIIENRHEIRALLKSAMNCGENKIYCHSLEPHWCVRENADGKLILQEYRCTKRKKYDEIADEIINDRIGKLVSSEWLSFDNEGAKLAISTLCKYSFGEKLNEFIRKIGDVCYHVPSTFNIPGGYGSYNTLNALPAGGEVTPDTYTTTESYFEDLQIAYAFHATLCGEDTMIIKSSEIKDIYYHVTFGFQKEESLKANEKYEAIMGVQNLIITDLGLENEISKLNYYLDFLPELLGRRKNGNKVTHIFSPITPGDLEYGIKISPKNNSKKINQHKLNSLKAIFKAYFGIMW